jgi:hypothetical protein
MAVARKQTKVRDRDVADKIVVDPSTGLEWSPTLGAAVNWATAGKVASACRLGGHDDWRLPTRKELLTLVDDTKFRPAANTDLFPDMKSDWYWTSTVAASSPSGFAWFVLFYYGGSDYGNQLTKAFVRAVRSSRASQ